MPAFTYTVPTSVTTKDEERSPLGVISVTPDNRANIAMESKSKLERIAHRARHGKSENSPQKKEPGQTETEDAVEAAVALLEKCAIAARARSLTHSHSPEEEAEAAEESAVTLVRACAAAACKRSNPKREATKMALQARVAELEQQISSSHATLREREFPEDGEYDSALGYPQKVATFIRKAKNPFEPANQQSLQVKLDELEKGIAESKALLRQKIEDKISQHDDQARGKVNDCREQLNAHEEAMGDLVKDLSGMLASHADKRSALQRQLQEALVQGGSVTKENSPCAANAQVGTQ